MTDTVKAAAIFLREKLASEGAFIGSSHAHAAIAAYCGFNSKKALIDRGPDLEPEFRIGDNARSAKTRRTRRCDARHANESCSD